MRKILMGLMGLLIPAILNSQTTIKVDSAKVTSTGYSIVVRYTVPPRDSLIITKQKEAGTESRVATYGKLTYQQTYARTVTVSKSQNGRYTFRARRWSSGKIADSAKVSVQIGPKIPVASLSICLPVSADTSIAKRVVGDTTYTTTSIIWHYQGADTTITTSVVVSQVTPTPPPPTTNTMPLDSVTITGPALNTDTTKVSFNIHAWPYPQTGATVSGRVLMDGVQVGTISQVPLLTTIRVPRPTGKSVMYSVCITVKGSLPVSPEKCSRPAGYVDKVAVITPSPTPLPSGVIFKDDFSSGDLNKVGPDGFVWGHTPQGNAWVNVISGFSHNGSNGNSVRFEFKGSMVSPTTGDYNAWAQLAFKLGKPVTELWQTYWLYFPKGGEIIAGDTLLPWENSGRFAPNYTSAGNNKFHAIYEAYEHIAGAPMHLSQTWNNYNGVTTPTWISSNRPLGGTTMHKWSNNGPFTPMTTGRGAWHKIELYDKLSSAVGVANGISTLFVDGQQVASVTDFDDLAPTPAPGIIGKFTMGYILGYENAAAEGIHYAYLSDYTASSVRLTQLVAGAPRGINTSKDTVTVPAHGNASKTLIIITFVLLVGGGTVLLIHKKK